jgi:hypothetical protein
MKAVYLLALIIVFTISACKQSTSSDKSGNTSTDEEPLLDSTGLTSPENGEAFILFYEDEHNFGNVIQGEKVTYSFKFKNIGNTDLIIATARGSCGCTVPTYPKRPIKAGTEGNIDVVFNSENLSGINQKTVTVITNSNPNNVVTLSIHSNVISASEKKNNKQ